jgi:uncharacterized protein (DUF849 family)
VNKLKDAEAVALKLQERLIAVQERADAAESQYTAVSMSLEKSKEEVGNLQTWSAELTHENQQLQSQVKQMATMFQENTGLKHQLANAQGQLQEILAKTETDANELKKSFREATLDGEVQVLKAQASESMILRSQVAELEHKLRESDTKEHLHVCFRLQTSDFVLIFWQNLLLQGLLHIDLSLGIHVLICHEEMSRPSLPIVLSLILLLHLLSYWPHLIMV